MQANLNTHEMLLSRPLAQDLYRGLQATSLARFVLSPARLFFLSVVLSSSGAPVNENASEHEATPELARLAPFVGTWDTTTTYRFAPEMPGFESRSVEKVRWAAMDSF